MQSELSFTVCLHYQFVNLDEEVQERRTIIVGKPLVSKLNLHEPQQLHTSSASFSSDIRSANLPQYSSFTQDLQESFPSLDASTSFSESTEPYLYTHTASNQKRINEPEENTSPEFLMSEEPRESKSFTYSSADKPFKFSNFHSF